MRTVSESLSLAPAAGAGLGKAMFGLLLADVGFAEVMAGVARECLRATLPPRWDRDRKCWGVETPDFRTRLQTFVVLMEQAEGMPIQRIIRESVGAGSGFDLDAELRENPALAEGLRRKLDNAAWRKSGRNTKRVQPSEPEPAPVPPDGK